MQPADFKGSYFPLLRLRARVRESITGNTRLCATHSVSAAIAFSAVAIPIPSQVVNCPPALTTNSTGGLSWLKRTSLVPPPSLPAEWRLPHSGENQRMQEQTEEPCWLLGQRTKRERKRTPAQKHISTRKRKHPQVPNRLCAKT